MAESAVDTPLAGDHAIGTRGVFLDEIWGFE
jgi:hypothetical protein